MARKRPAPKKPDKPLTAFVLSTGGKSRVESEHLPREQKALEQSIVERFLAAFKEQQGTTLTIAESREDRADVVLHDSRGQCIELQVTECVDEKRRRSDKPGFVDGRHFEPGEMSDLLSDVIGKKLHYPRPTAGQFWLLVYSIDLPVGGQSICTRSSVEMLQMRNHPFDRVWLFGPSKDSKAGGDLVELFPNPPELSEDLKQLDERKRVSVVWNPEDLAQNVASRRVQRESSRDGGKGTADLGQPE